MLSDRFHGENLEDLIFVNRLTTGFIEIYDMGVIDSELANDCAAIISLARDWRFISSRRNEAPNAATELERQYQTAADEAFDALDHGDRRLVRELIPSTIPDLFEGDRLVLLGQYRGSGPLTFRLKGSYLGRPRTFTFSFPLDSATTRNAFVPRLWASRRIASLIDQIRQAGHGAVFVHDLADHRRRIEAGEPGEIDAGLGMPGAYQYAAIARCQGKDVAGRDDIFGRRTGIDGDADRTRAIRRRDAGRHAIARFDRNRKCGFQAAAPRLRQ